MPSVTRIYNYEFNNIVIISAWHPVLHTWQALTVYQMARSSVSWDTVGVSSFFGLSTVDGAAHRFQFKWPWMCSLQNGIPLEIMHTCSTETGEFKHNDYNYCTSPCFSRCTCLVAVTSREFLGKEPCAHVIIIWNVYSVATIKNETSGYASIRSKTTSSI